uniref:Uncharacterized protein n=1 Tax=Anguilla anguilla TaxID=7936 RepID=A0A0E9QLG1_ANGAN
MLLQLNYHMHTSSLKSRITLGISKVPYSESPLKMLCEELR